MNISKLIVKYLSFFFSFTFFFFGKACLCLAANREMSPVL